MGNTLKLISGFILFVVGVLIVYEANVYNLIDILLVIGFILAIIGIIIIISYFIDSNADKTSSMFKEFLENNEIKYPSFNKSSNSNNGPLKIRDTFDDYYENDLPEYIDEEYYYDDSFDFNSVDDSKTVLRVHNDDSTTNFGNNLNFTPNYDKPLKITRKPKKRSHDYVSNNKYDKSEEIKRALRQDEEYIKNETYIPSEAKEISEPRNIKIDVNHPENLPVPKLLRSYVVYGDGLINSSEAFDKLAVGVNKEIMLEIPSLNDLSDRFLSHIPTIYSRVIINDFDVSDMAYTILISSLLKQGVQIKTVPKVHSINLLTDDSHAMIISKGSGNSDVEYGAIYEDRDSISQIRNNFERTWDIASNLDENLLINYTN
ncbi:hypothetical protein [uncultured Methanobrevibacter sp.]|uniref:hypothetical protein n=1 Tax=uncultured Methanobrevibacter sp. TaxID=253161 RepID=UPI00260AE904|nr:hypothetical protein [uncultured Methanobrevibacter sp.]